MRMDRIDKDHIRIIRYPKYYVLILINIPVALQLTIEYTVARTLMLVYHGCFELIHEFLGKISQIRDNLVCFCRTCFSRKT